MRIVIIGAGIAGLYLAWKLAEKSHRVTVFEKKEKIGKEACSGLFSERILDFIPESQKLIQNQINSVLIHFPKRTIRVRLSRNFFVMNHYQLDNLVANLTKKSGGKIILGRNISRSDLDILRKSFDRIIGCDGANSIVRKKLNLTNPNFRLAIQGFRSEKNASDYVETWPTEKGFLWKIPRGFAELRSSHASANASAKEVAEGKVLISHPRSARVVEYGIIETPKGAKLLFEEFLRKNNLELERINSALVSQGLIIPTNPKITLCGDAAGLTKPWSGGGVVWQLLAANILLKNFPDFLKYKNEAQRFFLPKIIFSKMATRMVYFLGFKTPWLLPKNVKIESDFLI